MICHLISQESLSLCLPGGQLLPSQSLVLAPGEIRTTSDGGKDVSWGPKLCSLAEHRSSQSECLEKEGFREEWGLGNRHMVFLGPRRVRFKAGVNTDMS